MDASIRPKGILDFLSQQEIRQLSDPQNGGLNELFRRCALAVLNSDSQTDSGKEMLAGFPDFSIKVVQQTRSIKLELRNAPPKAFVDGKLFWVECKTGDWQDYSARFKGLVPIFGADRTSAALLLIRPPDSGTRSRATDMLDMRVIAIDEVEGFITDFLDGLPGQKGKKSRRRVGKAEDEPALLDES